MDFRANYYTVVYLGGYCMENQKWKRLNTQFEKLKNAKEKATDLADSWVIVGYDMVTRTHKISKIGDTTRSRQKAREIQGLLDENAAGERQALEAYSGKKFKEVEPGVHVLVM